MNSLKDFEYVGKRAFYRPVGEATFEKLLDDAMLAIKTARQLGLNDILVNSIGVTGFAVPSALDRYTLGTRLVEAAGATLRVAIVARPEFIDPQRLSMVVFQNRGGHAGTFASETDALAWLDRQLGARLHRPERHDGAESS